MSRVLQHPHGPLRPHAGQVGADWNGGKDATWPLLGVYGRLQLEELVFEVRELDRNAELDRVARMVVRVEGATDRAAAIGLPPRALHELVEVTVGSNALEVLDLDGGIVVKGLHDGS